MGGSSKSQTVGYRYYVGMHMVLCRGPVDYVQEVLVDESTLIGGNLIDGDYTVNREDMFGGESREGGISGVLAVHLGKDDQTKDSYLVSKIGALVPAFRGVVSVVLKQMYLGINPYLKSWSFVASRTLTRRNGIDQWYPEKAAVPSNNNPTFRAFNVSWRLFGVPPVDAGGGYGWDSASSSPTSRSTVFSTGDGQTYTIELTAFGLIELRTYNGATPVAGTVVKGGSPGASAGFNVYKLQVSNPPATYYLNNGTSSSTLANVFQKFNIQVTDGATITLSYDVQDGRMIGTYQNLAVYSSSQVDMNPAHIIRECLTDPDWGMGYSEGDIDNDSFAYAADVLYDEAMGMSLLWDTQTTIEDFVSLVCKHINGAIYVDKATGLFVLKLIRDDYEESSLIELNPSNVSQVQDFNRISFGELVNSVTVSYYNASIKDTSTVTVTDIALASMQNATINTAVTYEGFTNSDIASRVAQRDLKTLSTPLVSCTVYANTDAQDLKIGDCFKLTWPNYDISGLVMRVTTIGYGDGKSNRVRLTCTQDVFSTPTVSFIAPTPPEGAPTDAAPVAVSKRLAFELPYLEAVQQMGQSVVDSNLATLPDIAYFAAVAARPSSNSLNARLWTNDGSGYKEQTSVDFCPFAELSATIDRNATTFAITNVNDFAQIQLDTWFQIDSEIMQVTAITTSSISVKRGLLDTVPAEHSAGATLFFWDLYLGTDSTQYVRTEVVSGKLVTQTGRGVLDLASAPADSVTMVGRLYRPYPPGQFKINASYFPSAIIGAAAFSWAHRSRTQQTGSSYVGFLENSIGPESGQTYTLQLYDETNTLRNTQSGLTGTSYSWTTEDADSGLQIVGESVFSKDWNDGSTANQTLYGNNSPSQSVSSGILNISSNAGTDVKIRFDSAPQMADFEFTCTLYPQIPTSGDIGILYRQTYWGNANDTFGYVVAMTTTGVFISKGSNSSSAAYSNLITVSLTSTAGVARNIRVRVVGTKHQVWVDDVLYITLTDSSYTTAGYFGARHYAYTTSAGQIDNLVIRPISSRLNGQIRAVLKSVRSSLDSYQVHDYTFKRAGYGYQYGNFYGGV